MHTHPPVRIPIIIISYSALTRLDTHRCTCKKDSYARSDPNEACVNVFTAMVGSAREVREPRALSANLVHPIAAQGTSLQVASGLTPVMCER